MSVTRCSTDRPARGPARQAGFSILEVMVVLIIVGLVAASMFEALSRLNDVRGRLGPFLSTSEREGLMNSWFRTAVNDIVPDKKICQERLCGQCRQLFRADPRAARRRSRRTDPLQMGTGL